MTTVSMLQFWQKSDEVFRRIERGERIILTDRGRPVARLEPVGDLLSDANDAAYHLYEHVDPAGKSLSNRQMDDLVYRP